MRGIQSHIIIKPGNEEGQPSVETTISEHVWEPLAGCCTSVPPREKHWGQLFLVPQVILCHWPHCLVPQDSGVAGVDGTAQLLLTNWGTTSQQITQLTGY